MHDPYTPQCLICLHCCVRTHIQQYILTLLPNHLFYIRLLLFFLCTSPQTLRLGRRRAGWRRNQDFYVVFHFCMFFSRGKIKIYVEWTRLLTKRPLLHTSTTNFFCFVFLFILILMWDHHHPNHHQSPEKKSWNCFASGILVIVCCVKRFFLNKELVELSNINIHWGKIMQVRF